MTTALITGATGGLGRETARRLAGLGWTLWLGARDLDAGEKVAAELRAGLASTDLPATDLASTDLPSADLRPLQLDVTSDDSVAAAYDVVAAAGTGLDVLVNNAGIIGARTAPADTTPADFLAAYGVNLLGPVRMTHAFLPLLRRSETPRLVMVSSGMGSFGLTSDPDRVESRIASLVYPSSKAALNMVTAMYAKALPEIRVTAVDPGYTATELNGFRGTQTVTEGTDAIVTACTADQLAGTFIDRLGAVPW